MEKVVVFQEFGKCLLRKHDIVAIRHAILTFDVSVYPTDNKKNLRSVFLSELCYF